jgi:NhaP-type Na+/H+ or K+/H+ antiporter
LRVIMVYLSAFIPRWLSPAVRRREKNPGLKLPFIVGWAGMRGVVSLASALAIPLTLNSGEPFPHRNLILFITFVVILITLVFQGLTLPLFIRFLKVEEVDDFEPAEEQIEAIRLQLAKESVAYMDQYYSTEMSDYETISRIKEQLLRSIRATEKAAVEDNKAALGSVRQLYRDIMLELVEHRRDGLSRLAIEKKFDDDIIRKMEHNLDLEEARLRKN